MIERLLQMQAAEQLVEITVTDCLYGCCARPLVRRLGYQQVYRGVIAAVDERKLILHSIALNALNYRVIVELDHLEDVEPALIPD